MIAYIRGELAIVEEDKAVVDVQGVGYGIFMPLRELAQLPPEGDEVKIYTYLNVREDAMQLFGFLRREEKDIFKMLLSVSGIGPKGALGILSHLTVEDLRFAIFSKDVKTISGAPGIGKRTAEKLILELKDKLSIEDNLPESSDVSTPLKAGAGVQADAVAALVALGYGNSESVRAVRSALGDNPDMDVEETLKMSLKYLL